MTEVIPFEIAISQDAIDDLNTRLSATRFPEAETTTHICCFFCSSLRILTMNCIDFGEAIDEPPNFKTFMVFLFKMFNEIKMGIHFFLPKRK